MLELNSTKSIVSTCGTSADRGSNTRCKLDVSADYSFVMTEYNDGNNEAIANELYPTPKLNVKIQPLSTLKRDSNTSEIIVNVDLS